MYKTYKTHTCVNFKCILIWTPSQQHDAMLMIVQVIQQNNSHRGCFDCMVVNPQLGSLQYCSLPATTRALAVQTALPISCRPGILLLQHKRTGVIVRTQRQRQQLSLQLSLYTESDFCMICVHGLHGVSVIRLPWPHTHGRQGPYGYMAAAVCT